MYECMWVSVFDMCDRQHAIQPHDTTGSGNEFVVCVLHAEMKTLVKNRPPKKAKHTLGQKNTFY